MAVIDHDIVYNNDETYLFTTMIISVYAEILFNKDRYTKALPFLDKAISLQVNNSGFEDINLSSDWYIALVFHRGIANSRKFNIGKAKEDFTWLTEYDPANEKYRMWLMSLKNRQLDLLGNVLAFILIAAICADIFLSREQHSIKNTIHFAVIYPCYFIFLITMILVAIRKRKMKKMR